MERKIRLSPSIIAVDYNNENELLKALNIIKETNVPLIHLDVMDGVFVKEKNLSVEFVERMKKETDCLLDVHLMVQNPEKVIDDYIAAGADILSVHFEATTDLREILKKIKANGVLAGVAIKPETPVEILDEYLAQNLIDVVLVMSVEPGACGRPFNPSALVKIEKIRRNYPKVDVAIDGGINQDNANLVVQCGANILIVGSGIFNTQSPVDAIENLKRYKQVKF